MRKVLFTTALYLALIALPVLSACAPRMPTPGSGDPVERLSAAVPSESPASLSPASQPPALPEIQCVTGTVESMFEVDGVSPEYTYSGYMVYCGDGTRAAFRLAESTYHISFMGASNTLTGWYDASQPSAASDPPTYTLIALAGALPGDEHIKIDRFDENLISSDNALKLLIGEDTRVADRRGTPYEGGLAGQILYVRYGESRPSAPAQTTPSEVTVLSVGVDRSGDAAPVESPADVAVYRGLVLSDYLSGETVLTLRQAEGTDFGGETLRVVLDEATKMNFDIEDLHGNDYLEAYYYVSFSNAGRKYAAALVLNRLPYVPHCLCNGTIVAINKAKGELTSVAVEELDTKLLTVFDISEETRIFADPDDLREGANVNVYFGGPFSVADNEAHVAAYEIRPYSEPD